MKFNPENKEILTNGEIGGPAMKITDKQEAIQYKEDYIKWHMKFTNDYETSKSTVESNLGYYAGYYDEKTRERVEDLFECAHPVFGSIKKNGSPSAKDAFEMGLNMAKKS